MGALEFVDGGRRLLGGYWDKTLAIWEVDSGTEIRRFSGHTAIIEAIAVSADGRTCLSGGADHLVKRWDLQTGRELRTFSGHFLPVKKVAFCLGGLAAISLDEDRACLWDLSSSPGPRAFRAHQGAVAAVAISPDGRTAFSSGEDLLSAFWDIATGQELQAIQSERALCVAFLANGRDAISGNVQGSLRLWDLSRGKVIRTFKGHTDWVRDVAVSRDGRTALSCAQDKMIRVWDTTTGVHTRCIQGPSGVLTVALSPDGSMALSGDWDAAVRLWDLKTGKEIRCMRSHENGVPCITFSPDGKTALSGGWDNCMILWEVATGRALRRFTGHSGFIFSVLFSPDGRTAFSGSDDDTIRAWDVQTGKELHRVGSHARGVAGLTLSQDGRVLLSASQDGTVGIWELDLPDRFVVLQDKANVAMRSLSGDPRDTASLRNLAEWYAFRGADFLVMELIDRARRLEVELSPLLQARCYWRAGRLDESRRAFELARRQGEAPKDYLTLCLEALTRAPRPCGTLTLGQVDDLNIEAWTKRSQNRLDEAEGLRHRVVHEARRILPAGHELLVKYQFHYAVVLMLMKRYDDALAQLLDAERGVQASRDEQAEGLLRQGLAEFYISLIFKGGAEDDRVALEGAIANRAQSPDHQNWQGIALTHLGRHREARAIFERTLTEPARWPSDPPADASLAQWTAAYWIGLVDEQAYVRRWAGTADAPGRRACEPWFYVGLHHHLRGELHKARRAYEKSVELGKAPSADAIWNYAAARLAAIDAPTSQPKAQTSTRSAG